MSRGSHLRRLAKVQSQLFGVDAVEKLSGKRKRQAIDANIRGVKYAGTKFESSRSEFSTSVRGKENRISRGSSMPSKIKGIDYGC